MSEFFRGLFASPLDRALGRSIEAAREYRDARERHERDLRDYGGDTATQADRAALEVLRCERALAEERLLRTFEHFEALCARRAQRRLNAHQAPREA